MQGLGALGAGKVEREGRKGEGSGIDLVEFLLGVLGLRSGARLQAKRGGNGPFE